MNNDAKWQRAKILVEETRKFYFQIIFTIGMLVVVIIRTLFIGNPFSSSNSTSFMEENLMRENISSYEVPDFTFIESPFFILIYIGGIFLLFLGYRYLKLYLLKRSFIGGESADKKLKKYMKTDEIPTTDDINTKFNEDKKKDKRKFYSLVIRVIALNIVIYYIYSTFLNMSFFYEIILAFSILTLFYRYLIVFHGEKKILGKDWENKKIEEYIQEFDKI